MGCFVFGNEKDALTRVDADAKVDEALAGVDLLVVCVGDAADAHRDGRSAHDVVAGVLADGHVEQVVYISR